MPSSSRSVPHPAGFLRHRDLIRWGMIGCGDVAEVKSGPGFQKAEGSQLIAVMRRDGARAADFAKRHGVSRWYANADALIADSEVDAVYIATPPDAHLEAALKVAAAGKPAYVEKPMARNTTECDTMLRAFATARVPLFVAYYRRRLPRFVLVENLLAQGAIGKVTSVQYEQSEPFHRRDAGWRTSPISAGGGHVLDVGSHVLDLMDHYFGALTQVTGTAANVASDYEVEDAVTMSFKTAQGIPGGASWNFASHARSDIFRIRGTDGQISFAVFDNTPVHLETADGLRTLESEYPAHVHQPLIQTIVDDLRGRGTCPSTGESARRTSHVLDTVLDAYYGGRQDAFWNRANLWPGRRR